MAFSLSHTPALQARRSLAQPNRTCLRPSRRGAVLVRAGLFDNLFGGFGGGRGQQTSARAAELVEELLDVARRTNGGSKANSDTRERIEELASELVGFRPRNATRSPYFNGTYEVTYCSNPRAPGGPLLRSPPGQLFASGQRLTQTLQAPNLFQNNVEFKTLGLFPGSATQDGTYRIVSGTRYQVDLEPAALKLAGGKGLEQGGEVVTRTFDVIYLDERARVVQFLPEDEGEPQLFVFERLGEDDDEEEEDDGALYADEEASGLEQVEAEVKAKAPKKAGGFFGFGRKPAPEAEEEQEEEEEESVPQPPQRGGKGGTRRVGMRSIQTQAMTPEEKKQEEIRRRLAELQEAVEKQQAVVKSSQATLRDLEKEQKAAEKEAQPAQRSQEGAEAAAARKEEAAQAAAEQQQELSQKLSGARQRVRELQTR